MLLEVSADNLSGWYLVAFGLRPFAYLAWVCHSRVGLVVGGVVDSASSLQGSLTLGWMWPRSRMGESACVLRASDLSFTRRARTPGSEDLTGLREANVPRIGWYRLLIKPTGTRALHSR